MLYKVTPNLTPQPEPKKEKDPNAPKVARKRRKSLVYDADGHEVLITMMCLKCKSMKPLSMFGLRKMADGAVRNQPWCRTCRSGASSKKKPEAEAQVQASAPVVQVAAVPVAAEAAPVLHDDGADADGADADTASNAVPAEAEAAL